MDLTIGQDWWRVPSLLPLPVDDASFWLDHMDPDETIVRLHHRLVWIHPFRNGNGRWARIVADLMSVACGQPAFSWGLGLDPDERRPRYVAALRRADRENTVDDLVAFARV